MHNWVAITSTLIIAIILALLPMPDWTVWLRPAWVLMVLIYWSMTMPYRVGVGTAWIVGIMMDILNGSVLGEHALAYTAVVYAVLRLNLRLRMYPLMQQGFSVFIFVMMQQFILYCIQGFIGELPSSQLFWLSPITSMLLWPWLFVLLKDSRRWLRVA